MRLRIRAKEEIPLGFGYSSRTRDRSVVHTVYTSYEEAGHDWDCGEDSTYYFRKGYDNYWIKKKHCDIVGEPIIGGELVE